MCVWVCVLFSVNIYLIYYRKINKKISKCVFRFILDFGVSADLEWWIYVDFFAHLPDEDCVVQCGLCSV